MINKKHILLNGVITVFPNSLLCHSQIYWESPLNSFFKIYFWDFHFRTFVPVTGNNTAKLNFDINISDWNNVNYFGNYTRTPKFISVQQSCDADAND